MSVVTVESRYGKENLVMCDHCRKLLHPEWSEYKYVVAGRDANGENVEFCDEWCAHEAGYEKCANCGLWVPKETLDENHECQLCVKAKQKKNYVATVCIFVSANTLEEAKESVAKQLVILTEDCFFSIKEEM